MNTNVQPVQYFSNIFEMPTIFQTPPVQFFQERSMEQFLTHAVERDFELRDSFSSDSIKRSPYGIIGEGRGFPLTSGIKQQFVDSVREVCPLPQEEDSLDFCLDDLDSESKPVSLQVVETVETPVSSIKVDTQALDQKLKEIGKSKESLGKAALAAQKKKAKKARLIVKKEKEKQAAIKQAEQQKLEEEKKRLEEEARLAAQRLAEQERLARGFDFEPLVQKSDKASYIDPFKFARDFRSESVEPNTVGKLHVVKRLELFKFMCTYVEDKSDHLKDYTFSLDHNQNEYAATGYIVPKSHYNYPVKEGFTTYERTHIGLLNKIVVQHTTSQKLYKLAGEVIFKEKKTDLHTVFNLCDIAAPAINAIDGIMEFHLRKTGKKLLEEVRAGTKTALKASASMEKKYKASLLKLETNLKNGNNICPVSTSKKVAQEYERTMNIIFDDKKSPQYMTGMLKAFEA